MHVNIFMGKAMREGLSPQRCCLKSAGEENSECLLRSKLRRILSA